MPNILKNNKLLIPYVTAAVIILFSLVVPVSCASRENTQPLYWQKLREDKGWVDSLNQYLDLAYVEASDIAAFISPSSATDLQPALYSTYSVFRILESIGAEILNQEKIIQYIDSLRNQNGAYIALTTNPYPLTEVNQALTVLIGLGGEPQSADVTADYILSCLYEDGTFLTNPGGAITLPEKDTSRRITLGTAAAVYSLKKLGQTDKIPQATQAVIRAEIDSKLAADTPYPDLTESVAWNILAAIEVLANIDPLLVTEHDREFVVFALNGLLDIPEMVEYVYLFPARANRLLDIAEITGLSVTDNTLDGIRNKLQEKVFPQQNHFGGFGPETTIEPLMTSENVILSQRLGLDYPDLAVLLIEIEKHWMGNGWSTFYENKIVSSSYIFTHYALEIARFSGFDRYDREKVSSYLRGAFLTNQNTSDESSNLRELYHALMALKVLKGELNEEERTGVQAQVLKLSRDFRSMSESDYSTSFTYTARIAQEAGFTLPEDMTTEIIKLAVWYKDDLLNDKKSLLPGPLLNLWEAVEEPNKVLSADEAKNYLNQLYDEESGAYYASIIGKTESESKQSNFVYHPEINQTYNAIELLSRLNREIADKDKTYNFVMGCKEKYGFSRAPDLPGINIEAIYAAVKILEKL